MVMVLMHGRTMQTANWRRLGGARQRDREQGRVRKARRFNDWFTRGGGRLKVRFKTRKKGMSWGEGLGGARHCEGEGTMRPACSRCHPLAKLLCCTHRLSAAAARPGAKAQPHTGSAGAHVAPHIPLLLLLLLLLMLLLCGCVICCC